MKKFQPLRKPSRPRPAPRPTKPLQSMFIQNPRRFDSPEPTQLHDTLVEARPAPQPVAPPFEARAPPVRAPQPSAPAPISPKVAPQPEQPQPEQPAPQPEQPAPPSGMVLIALQVPAGCQPGQIISAQHNGQTIQVACPPGFPPGATFQVQVPATPAAQPVTT